MITKGNLNTNRESKMKIDMASVAKITKIDKLIVDVEYMTGANKNTIIYNSENDRDIGFHKMEVEFEKHIFKLS